MTQLPQISTENQEQSLQPNHPDPLLLVDKFLNQVSPDAKLESYRQVLLNSRSPGFKATVKFLEIISSLRTSDPSTAEAFVCLELKRWGDPKVYGKAQRARLLELAKAYATTPTSSVAAEISSNQELFNEVLKIERLTSTAAENLAKLRPVEQRAESIDKIAKNFLDNFSEYLLQPPDDRYAYVYLNRVFTYFKGFSDSEFASNVLNAISQKNPKIGNRVISLITYFSNLSATLAVERPGLPREKHEIGVIFSDDMAFLQGYTGFLSENDRKNLAQAAIDLCAKLPDIAKLTEQVKVSKIAQMTQANVARALDRVNQYTEAIIEVNEALDTAQLADFQFNIDFHTYSSPATYEIIEYSKPVRRISLNSFNQILTYNGGYHLSVTGAPPELKGEVELLHQKFDTVKERFQHQLAERFEEAIPAIVSKAEKIFEPLANDDYKSITYKLEQLDRCLANMDRPYYWGDKHFPSQFEKLIASLRLAAKKQKKALMEALPEKQKLLKLKKLQEAELAYREEVIKSRIEYLLKKYGIAADLPLSDINVSVYTSEKSELIYDHVLNRDSTGQKSDLNYEIGQDSEFMNLKEKAIDLIIPHEIGHLVIDEFKQTDLFLSKRKARFEAAQADLEEKQKALVKHHISECVVDGVGFGLSLAFGGTNTQPGQSGEILIELSKAFANLEKVLELQGERDGFAILMNRLRMSANAELLIDEAKKFQVAEELVNGFHQAKNKYNETIERSNQKLPTPLSMEQLNDLKQLMREAIEFGRQIKHAPKFREY